MKREIVVYSGVCSKQNAFKRSKQERFHLFESLRLQFLVCEGTYGADVGHASRGESMSLAIHAPQFQRQPLHVLGVQHGHRAHNRNLRATNSDSRAKNSGRSQLQMNIEDRLLLELKGVLQKWKTTA